jgi:hypothetical protein
LEEEQAGLLSFPLNIQQMPFWILSVPTGRPLNSPPFLFDKQEEDDISAEF